MAEVLAEKSYGMAADWWDRCIETYGDTLGAAFGVMGPYGYAAVFFFFMTLIFTIVTMCKRKWGPGVMGIICALITIAASLLWRYSWLESAKGFWYPNTLPVTQIVAIAVSGTALLMLILCIVFSAVKKKPKYRPAPGGYYNAPMSPDGRGMQPMPPYGAPGPQGYPNGPRQMMPPSPARQGSQRMQNAPYGAPVGGSPVPPFGAPPQNWQTPPAQMPPVGQQPMQQAPYGQMNPYAAPGSYGMPPRQPVQQPMGARPAAPQAPMHQPEEPLPHQEAHQEEKAPEEPQAQRTAPGQDPPAPADDAEPFSAFDAPAVPAPSEAAAAPAEDLFTPPAKPEEAGAPKPAVKVSPEEVMEKFRDLLQMGVITQREYEEQKKKLMGE